MTCICAPKLEALLDAVVAVEPPTIGLPGPLLQLSGLFSASASLSASLAAGLPALPLSAGILAQFSAVAQAAASVKAGLGIDLLLPGASAELSATIGSLNANLGALLPLCQLSVAPWLSLSALASLALSVKSGFGVGLLAANACAALSAALSASLSLPLPAAGGSASALLSAAASLGVDLSASGGLGQLAANASLIASLTIPPIGISAMLLLGPLQLMTALANIKLGLGLGLGDLPGGALGLGASLSQYAALSIPVGLSAGGSLPALDLNASALASADLCALASLQLPNLAPLTAFASFAAQCSLAGLPITSASPCGASCPLSLSVSI